MHRRILSAILIAALLIIIPSASFALADPPCGSTVMSNTKLSADLDCSLYAGTALTITGSNVVLNCNGHTITAETGYDANDVSGVSYVTMETCGITGATMHLSAYPYAIYLDNVVHANIKGNNVYGNYEGIVLYGADSYITVKNNIASGNQEAGIGVWYLSSNNVISGNTVNDNGEGLYVYETGTGNTFTGNSASGNTYGVYDYESTNNVFTQNIELGDGIWGSDYGFYIYYSASETYSFNHVTSNYYGFYVYDGSTANTIIGNTLNKNGYAVYVYDASNNNVYRANLLQKNYYPIYIDGTDPSLNNLFYANNISSNTYVPLGYTTGSGTLGTANAYLDQCLHNPSGSYPAGLC